jgi:hypothetical protein
LLSTITWASDVSGDWDNASMWTGGGVPGSGDDAVINFAEITVTHASAVSDTVNSLKSQGAIAITGGSLALANSSSISNTLSLSPGGTLTLAGNLTVAGAFTWTGGTLAGSAGSVVTAQQGVSLAGPGNMDLVGCTLINPLGQTADWTAGEVLLDDGATLDNQGAFLDETVGGRMSFTIPSANPGFFVNEAAASYTKSGTGTTSAYAPWLNEGAVSAQAGTLLLSAELSPVNFQIAGSFTGAAGTTLDLYGMNLDSPTIQTVGAVIFEDNSDGTVGAYSAASTGVYNNTLVTFAGAVSTTGPLVISGGYGPSTASFSPSAGPATLTVPGLTLYGGSSLAGTDSFLVTGLFDWQAGSLTGAAGSVVTAQQGVSLAGPGNLILGGRTLINPAGQTADWMGGVILLQDGATLDNQGAFLDQTAGGVMNFNTTGNPGSFVNEAGASYTKSGNGSTTLYTAWVNYGSVNLQAGSLTFNNVDTDAPVDLGGSFTGAAGTTLDFFQNLAPLDNPTIQSAGAVIIGADGTLGAYSAASTVVDGDTLVTVAGPISATGPLVIGDGPSDTTTATFSPSSGPLTLTVPSLTLDGGSLAGIDSFVVAGLFDWQAGGLIGPQGSALTAEQGVSLAGPGNMILDGRTLINPAGQTADWTGGEVVVDDGAALENQGAFLDQTSAGAIGVGTAQNPGSFVNAVGASYCKSGTGTTTSVAAWLNLGTVNVEQGVLNLSTAANSGMLTVAPGTSLGANSYIQNAGSTVLNGGTLNGDTYSINAGALTGTGTIDASVSNGGQLIPGGTGASGVLTINGTYTQTANGALDIDIGGTTAGSQYDQLVVSGTASLGGAFNIATLGSFATALGNTFQVLTFGSPVGNFRAYNGTSLASGLFLAPVFTASRLTLDTDQVAISGAPAFPLQGAPIDLVGSVTGPSVGNPSIFNYAWTVTENSNPFATGSGSTVSFTPSLNGTYLVSLTVTDAAGGKGTTSSQLIVAPTILVLDPTAGGALSLSGNASINTPGAVYVDSSYSSALSASGNATVEASVIDVHGKASKSGNATFCPAPVTGAAVLSDPLAGLAVPVASALGLTCGGPVSLSGNSSKIIGPSVYSQISLSGNASLTLNPGVYIITGGGLTVSGNASVSVYGPSNTITGTGVTIYNAGSGYNVTTGADGGSFGAITLNASGTIKLVPPSTGTYAGILIFQARDDAKALTLSGNALQGLSGEIYAPAAQLAESGNAQIGSTSNPISIIVDTLSASGNAIADGLTLTAPSGSVAYSPAQIRTAYGISALLGAATAGGPTPSLDGTGQTIAIVDAYDDPNIFQSVDAFDSQFGLTTSGPTLYTQYGPSSSFLTVLNQAGQPTSLPSADPRRAGTENWEVEEALDVEWAHAIAPGAQIVLVEANSQSLSDLMASVATAGAQPGVSVVSMSWGFAEGQAAYAADEAAYDSVFSVPGVTFIASTGDYGASDPQYPAFSPNVVAVGGTSLTLNADNSYNSETGWGYYSSAAGASIGSGGGISLYEPEPAFQQGVQSLGMRTTPDVALVADPNTGAWIADTYNLDPTNPFEVVGGTSLSAPAWAGLLALVNQGRASAGEPALNSTSPTEVQQALYSLPQRDYNAITSGSNGYSAGPGYNLVTGLGTPVANLLVPDLLAYQGPGTTYSGPTVGALQNGDLNANSSGGGGADDVFSVFDSIRVTATVPANAAVQKPFQRPGAFRHGAKNISVGDGAVVGQPFSRRAGNVVRLESLTYNVVKLESLIYGTDASALPPGMADMADQTAPGTDRSVVAEFGPTR